MPDYFEDGILNERGGWHGLGDVWDREVNGPLYPAIAMKHRSMDWTVEKRPVWTINGDGDLFVVANQFEVVRKMDDKVLTTKTVGKQYKEIQNEQGFTYLDQLIDAGELEIETAISLHEGRVISILARKPDGLNIAGDKHDRFIGFTNRHDGQGACKVFTCYERVVCANTLGIAVGEFKKTGRHWTIRHQGNTELKLSEARAALQLSYEQDEALALELESMARQDMSKEEYGNVLQTVSGLREIDKGKQPRKHRNALELCSRIHEIRRNRPDLQNLRPKSKLRLLNAITAYETHERTFKNEGTKFQHLAVEGGELTNLAFAALTA